MSCQEKNDTNKVEFEINPDWVPYGVALGVVLTLLTVVGNAVVVRAVYSTHTLQNIANYFLVSLAAADLCVGVVVLPVLLARFVVASGPDLAEASRLNTAVEVLHIQSFTASTYNLCAVTIDRYIAVRLPLRYESLMTIRRYSIIIACVWVLSLLSGFIRFTEGHLFWFVTTTVTFLVPGAVITYCYKFMLGEARRQRRNISQQNSEQRIVLERNNKAAITVAIVIGTFLLFALPMIAVTLTESVLDLLGFCEQEDKFEAGSVWALLVSFANSALNPFIYAIRKREFRDAFKRILCRKNAVTSQQ